MNTTLHALQPLRYTDVLSQGVEHAHGGAPESLTVMGLSPPGCTLLSAIDMKKKLKKQDYKLLYAYGRPFSPFYSFIMGIRAALYQRKVFKVERLSVPVISIGNLTMGGTGKTPVVIYLAKMLGRDFRPAVISRGYGGQAGKKVNIVSDGREILLNPPVAADEACLVAENTDVAVLTGSDRALAARHAVEHLDVNLVLLDDGFQHMRLHRDINLVLFKEATFLGNNRVFPGGDMREPLKALERADAFVITSVVDRQKAGALKKALRRRFPGIPVFLSEYQPVGVVDRNGSVIPAEKVKKMMFWAFCGLAHPDSFKHSLANYGLSAAGFTPFKDHQSYSNRKIKRLVSKAQKAGADALLTTEKDLVKLRNFKTALPIMALRMEVRMPEEFCRFIKDSLEKL